MSNYSQHVNTKAVSQTEPARLDQVENNAGGFVFQITNWQRLDRFLILGNEGGTYYASAKKLTRENAACIDACLRENAERTIDRIVEISNTGRAPKNDPAIFAIAIAASSTDLKTRQMALQSMPKVCRIGTHLFHFAQEMKGLRKWSRGYRTAISNWYNNKTADQAAFQAVKYQQRDGWSHKDLLSLAHTKAATKQHAALYRWVFGKSEALLVKRVVGKDDNKREYPELSLDDLPTIVHAFEEIHSTQNPKTVIDLIRKHRMPHETVPNEWKNNPDVWEAMLDGMGHTALLRNLAKMTAVGLLKPMSEASKKVVAALTNVDALKAGRIHPIQILVAMEVYSSGHGDKGSLTWDPVSEINGALNDAFYLAFDHIEPTGKNYLLALDVSGSMSGGSCGGTSLTPRVGSAAMAMITSKTEKNVASIAFSNGIKPLDLGKHRALADVVKAVSGVPFDYTDCSQPMLYAMKNKLDIDAFVVYTDSETYHGAVHPFKALQQYRDQRGKNAQLIVVGMAATEFTIADPKDPNMMDVVGFDASAPAIMNDFVRGNLYRT